MFAAVNCFVIKLWLIPTVEFLEEVVVSNDTLGDRMKMYECAYTSEKAMPLLPVCARIDGRAFHSLTQNMSRPFDSDFMEVMQEVTKKLVQETNAGIGYTQSDEITLIWANQDRDSEIFFNGKLFKMVSMLASMTTAYFNAQLHRLSTSKTEAFFDCRVWQVPTLEEASNVLLWRELDAAKNSISMVARAHFSHKQVQNKNSDELQEMLFSEKGVNWNDLSVDCKRGSYFKRVRVVTKFSREELARLPEMHEARRDPNLEVERVQVQKLTLPRLSTLHNKVGVLFYGEEATLRKN